MPFTSGRGQAVVVVAVGAAPVVVAGTAVPVAMLGGGRTFSAGTADAGTTAGAAAAAGFFATLAGACGGGM